MTSLPGWTERGKSPGPHYVGRCPKPLRGVNKSKNDGGKGSICGTNYDDSYEPCGKRDHS